MPAPTRQRSFSAKSQPESRPGPPRKKKLDPAVREYLRPDEVEAMVQATRKAGRHQVRDAAILLLMFRHGLRTAELVALRWQQVDLKAGYLDVHRVKRGHDAKHPLRGPQLRLLRELQRTYPDSPYVFVSERKAAPVSTLHSRDRGESRRTGGPTLRSPSAPIAACMRVLLSRSRA